MLAPMDLTRDRWFVVLDPDAAALESPVPQFAQGDQRTRSAANDADASSDSLLQRNVGTRERWFVVLDAEAAALAFPAPRVSPSDDLARSFQQSCGRHSGPLSFGEVWSILNPVSIAQFLRCSMADVF